jgi:hypothetical protein
MPSMPGLQRVDRAQQRDFALGARLAEPVLESLGAGQRERRLLIVRSKREFGAQCDDLRATRPCPSARRDWAAPEKTRSKPKRSTWACMLIRLAP